MFIKHYCTLDPKSLIIKNACKVNHFIKKEKLLLHMQVILPSEMRAEFLNTHPIIWELKFQFNHTNVLQRATFFFSIYPLAPFC